MQPKYKSRKTIGTYILVMKYFLFATKEKNHSGAAKPMKSTIQKK
jgi:hypothetical protein